MASQLYPELNVREEIVNFQIGKSIGRCHFFGTILLFDQPLVDSQVLTLVQKAHAEMKRQCATALPAAMTALLTPDRRVVILASSMKKIGGSLASEDFFYSWESAAALLTRGRPLNSPQAGHRTGGCGEVVALGLWLECCTSMDNTNCMFVLTLGTTRSDDTLRHREPCGIITHRMWGCHEVWHQMGSLP